MLRTIVLCSFATIAIVLLPLGLRLSERLSTTPSIFSRTLGVRSGCSPLPRLNPSQDFESLIRVGIHGSVGSVIALDSSN
ncbi:hypothetical protein BJ322DRAFT_1083620 [Thelephora terrestris]|uniref:Uncharacterized protein n=1 Tax=Thelephora terrestris TaxID=56493 RepID=A0A9P6H6J9_9AGAM|nr:hypothetical protein BJ322DRAFT_1083620 [Thelephora terrestris]